MIIVKEIIEHSLHVMKAMKWEKNGFGKFMAIKFIDLLNIIIITICLMILYINKINI
jgi:hypothetical protein